MSYSSNYNLNQRISYLESIIAGIVPFLPINLANTLLAGNSAGASDIDLNGNLIIDGKVNDPTTELDIVNKKFVYNTAFEDFLDTDVLGAVIRFFEIGGGSAAYFNDALSTDLQAGGIGRRGFLQVDSGVNRATCTSNTQYSWGNTEKVTFGFVPLGDKDFGTEGRSLPTNFQIVIGLTQVSNPVGSNTTNSIVWKNLGIGWEFVINNVVIFTSATVDLTGKYCRVSFDITEPSPGNFSVSSTLVNLNDGISETTPVVALVPADFSFFAPQTMALMFVAATTDGTNKYLGIDYCQVKQKLYDVGVGDTSTYR